jgi:hypothetical protein
MANATNNVIRGQSFKGVAHLKTVDVAGLNPQPYVIVNTDVIEVHLPADPNAPNSGAPVILSTANSGEVTRNSPDPGDVSFNGPPAKTLLMEVGPNLALDVKVTHLDGSIDIFEQLSIINVTDPANA